MIIALWLVNGLLALAYLLAGGMKLIRNKDALRPMMAWVEDFPGPVIKLIGAAEVLGALGLILPLATGIAPILTPISAVCLAIVMAGAVVTHIRRKETVVPPLILGVLDVVSAVLGFLVVLGR